MKEIIKINTNESGNQVISAKELYFSLDLSPTQYNRWIKKNIENNQFAEVGKDWVILENQINDFRPNVEKQTNNSRLNVENPNKRGRQTKDYALSIDFAKKLSMLARTEKGERIRSYFVEVEKVAISQASRLERQRLFELERKITRLEAQATTSQCNEFSIFAYSRLCNKRVYGSEAVTLGKRATKLSKENNLPIGKVRDPRFGEVNTYPEEILKIVFADFFSKPRF